MSILDNTNKLQSLMDKINAFPEAGGIELPTLTNEGSPEDLLKDKQLISHDGSVITGTFTLDDVAEDQDTLIADIITALDNKAGGFVPIGTIQINENGTYDVTEYASAVVDVPTGGGDDPRFVQLMTGTLPALDDSTLTTVRGYAFYGVKSLETARLSVLTSVPAALFQNCSSLETVDLPQAAGRMGNNAFQNCTSLKNVNIPKITNLVNYAFSGCSSLEKLDLSEKFVGFSGGAACGSCGKLAALILRRSSAIVTLGNSNNLTGTPIASGTGYIYVPRALVDTYKAASNWSNYASQFRSIEDYPDITGG